MRAALLPILAATAWTLLAPPSARAQGPRRWTPVNATPAVPAAVPDVPALQIAARSPALVTASSLALPGMGQLMLGKRRWAVYSVVELAGWVIHLDRRRAGRRLRADYRELAWITARGLPVPREDGDWDYYETLSHWRRSGAFDLDDAAGGVQPEMAADSYNGSVWALARDLYLPAGAGADHPAWARALAYYEEHAIPPELLWDWTGREAILDLYGRLIDQSDEALRTATAVLGAVVANHLLSAADAFVSSRLGVDLEVGAAPVLGRGASGFEWMVEVRP